MLFCKHPRDTYFVQVVLLETLRAHVPHLFYNSPLLVHPVQTRLYNLIRKGYYWAQMTTYIMYTVR